MKKDTLLTKNLHRIFWIIFAAWIALLLTGCAAMKVHNGPVKLTVTMVRFQDGKTEVWARRDYRVYVGRFDTGGPADTLRRGSIIIADPYQANPRKDTCEWVFRRVR